MAHRAKNSGLASQGLRYKLRVAAALMSVLPLLVCAYLVSNFIIPKTGPRTDVILSLTIGVFISLIGFFLVKQVFDRIASVSSDAKLIAAGDITRKIRTTESDEIGEVGIALNQLSERIRSSMDELRQYGERTTEINLEIQKRVIALSSLLNVSSLITQGAKLGDIFKLITEKSRMLANSEMSYLFLREEGKDIFHMKAAEGLNADKILKIKIGPGDPLYELINRAAGMIIQDRQNKLPGELGLIVRGNLGAKNTLICTVYLKGRIVACLGVGNSYDSFIYSKEDTDMLDIFAKQIGIAIENDALSHRIEKLEIKDALTGLYNDSYIRNRLQEEIERSIAYQRPCALVIFNIDNFELFYNKFGLMESENMLKKVSVIIKDSVTDIDRVARIGDNEFAVVLPEKNKRHAQSVADQIRERVESGFKGLPEEIKRITVSGGVSENPLDGIEASELFAKAKERLGSAKSQGKNRVLAV